MGGFAGLLSCSVIKFLVFSSHDSKVSGLPVALPSLTLRAGKIFQQLNNLQTEQLNNSITSISVPSSKT